MWAALAIWSSVKTTAVPELTDLAELVMEGPTKGDELNVFEGIGKSI